MPGIDAPLRSRIEKVPAFSVMIAVLFSEVALPPSVAMKVMVPSLAIGRWPKESDEVLAMVRPFVPGTETGSPSRAKMRLPPPATPMFVR